MEEQLELPFRGGCKRNIPHEVIQALQTIQAYIEEQEDIINSLREKDNAKEALKRTFR